MEVYLKKMVAESILRLHILAFKKLGLSILFHGSSIPLLGIDPKECESGYNKGTYTSMFIAALFTIAMLWEQPRCPSTDEWIKKM
jgi:hypothetical protein